MATKKPTGLTIRSYDVGFGDAFLLSFRYAAGDRHVLIDFGSMRQPQKAGGGPYMERVAREIAKDCGGKLHAVVATHRHLDHISGFAMENGKGPGKIIRDLKPDVVVQPWTEDPAAAKDAVAPKAKAPARAGAVRAYLRTLADMGEVAAAVAQRASLMQRGVVGAVGEQLQAIGMDNIKNPTAVRNLQTMSPHRYYAYHGSKSGLESVLPGVKIRVLGPPTLEQTDSIRKQRAKDKDEFWLANGDFWQRQALTARTMLAPASGKGGKPPPLFPQVAVRAPRDGRWFRYNALREQAESLLSIVRVLDDAMNNTSLILLFEVAGKRILFPGDAQYENWMYALGKPAIRKLLESVDVYKVGHHGSTNATPKTLWKGFAKRGGKSAPDRLTTILSTKDHVHGNEKAGTEVPRSTLTTALEKESTLVDTRRLGESALSNTVDIDF